MNEQLISVIIPCKNTLRMLPLCLDSLLAQDHPHMEIIFADHGSTDGSREYAMQLARKAHFPIHVLSVGNPGIKNTPRLEGFLEAQGSLIMWMDSDDSLAPTSLSARAAALESGAYDVATSELSLRTLHPESLLLEREIQAPTYRHAATLLSKLILEFPMWHRYLYTRKAAQEIVDAGGLTYDAKNMEDYEVAMVSSILKHRTVRVPESHVFYHLWSPVQCHRLVQGELRLTRYRDMYARLLALAAKVAFELSPMEQSFLDPGHVGFKKTPGSMQAKPGWTQSIFIPAASNSPVPLTRLEAILFAKLAEGECFSTLAAVCQGLLNAPGFEFSSYRHVAESLAALRAKGLLPKS